jgi:hypothetical protein
MEGTLDTQIYIAGMSNTDAIRSALKDYQGSTKILLDRLNTKTNTDGYTNNVPDPEYFRSKVQAKLVALSLWGNWYNAVGIIEHTVPFDFIYPSFDETVDESRRVIPFTQLHRLFNNNIRHRISAVKVIRGLTSSKIVLIDIPPPIEDESHIKKYHGTFGEVIEAGVTPARIRMKLWKLQNSIYEDVARENQADILVFPPQAKSATGFLAPEYCRGDPTHANAKYGALVISQLEDLYRSLP